MVKCVVSGCPNRTEQKGIFSRTPKRFFNFPKDPARVKVWLAALRETDKQDLTEQHIICEDHFLTDHITVRGVSEDAIPIMPPYLDGPLGIISPWGAESSGEEVEEEQWADGTEEEMDEEDSPPGQDSRQLRQDESLDNALETETYSSAPPKVRQTAQKRSPRSDTSLVLLTQQFLELMLAAPDGVLDCKQAAGNLQTQRCRVYEIANILRGISLVEKKANKVKWIGKSPVSCFLGRSQQRFQKELGNLKVVEETLDELIKTCAQQLFNLTDDKENSRSAYVTHEDISRIKVFQDQTVIVIKAPEETKLEVPAPKEDSIQIHLKAGKGPIKVMTCDMGCPQEVLPTNDGEKAGCFATPEESRIKTAPLESWPLQST
ncbi:transcription factor E2F6 [Lampris incognitus]|uniref:transcription factor E2F6 n=1 Tax=Lampris incognitus TaxID=2546036 RepID=UPI0024B5C66E|nr:transcription factor E2F6 [Lampris incognitus]